MIVVAAYYLGEHIKAAGAENEVNHFVEPGNGLRDFQQSLTGGTYTDHACQREPKLNRVGHCDNLHDLGIDQTGDTLTYTGLRNPQIQGYFGEGPAPILL